MHPCLSDAELDCFHAREMSEEESARATLHLDQCPNCRARDAHLVSRHQRLVQWLQRVGRLDESLTAAVAIEPMEAVFTEQEVEVRSENFPRIAGYDLIREIHRGGQGTVYLANQRSTRRRVAIKVMHERPFTGRGDKARFEREVQILARMKSPNIVSIHDSGVTDRHRFYYVMDYVEGWTLSEVISAGDPGPAGESRSGAPRLLTARRVLELFVVICDAADSAHMRGIIHRDLKPGNIIVDAHLRPHILDFGLAKLSPGVKGITCLHEVTVTQPGQFLGSLPWASPEQVDAAADDLDVRTDVYSLGVMLFQCLAGRHPYGGALGMGEMLNSILTRGPSPPSTIPGALPGLDAEIDTIVLTCLQKDRSRRYRSAGQLAHDIRAYLAGEPIGARRDSAVYVLRKKLLRHKAVSALTAALLIALLVFSTAVAIQSGHRERERIRAVDAEQREAVERRRAEAERDRANHEAEALRRKDYFLRIASADSAYRACQTNWMLDLLNGCPAELRGWEWHRLARIADVSYRRLPGAYDPTLEVSPDGRLLFVKERGGDMLVLEADTGMELQRFHVDAAPRGLEMSPDQTLLAVQYGNGVNRLIRRSDGQILREFGSTAFSGHAFSPDGGLLAWADDRPPPGAPHSCKLKLMQVQSGETVNIDLAGVTVNRLRFSSDGKSIALACDGGQLAIFDVAQGKLVQEWKAHCGPVSAIAFVPGGRQLVSGSFDKTLGLWHFPDGALIRRFYGHLNRVQSVSVSEDGRYLVSAADDRTARLWSAESSEPVRVFRGHRTVIKDLEWLPGSTCFVSVDDDGEIRYWGRDHHPDILEWRPAEWISVHAAVGAAVFSPDEKRILSVGHNGYVCMWDSSRPAQPIFASNPFNTELHAAAFSESGDRFLLGGKLAAFGLFDASAGRLLKRYYGHLGPVRNVRFLPGGRRILTSSGDGTCRIWDIESGECLHTLQHDAPLWTTALSLDGRRIACGTEKGDVFVWDADDGKLLRRSHIHQAPVNALAFSPEGQQLVSGGYNDGKIVAQEVDSGEVTAQLQSQGDRLYHMTFTPDGRRLVSAGLELIEFWDLDRKELVLSFQAHDAPIYWATFSPDGRRLLTSSADGSFKVWPARSDQPQSLPSTAAPIVEAVNFN